MAKRRTYSKEQLLILDSKFMEIFPLDLSMNDGDTLKSLVRHYYNYISGPGNKRLFIEDCENSRLFCAVKNIYEEAEKRLKQYKEDLPLALSGWSSLNGNDISVIQQIVNEKRKRTRIFGNDYLSERLCIQLEHLPLEIGINGRIHPYPLLLLYQQL